MITNAIKKAYRDARQKEYIKMYWAFDVHGTIIQPDWKRGSKEIIFTPGAKEALQLISRRKEIVKILYTCSYPDEIERYLEFFHSHGIFFDYINENPEATNSEYGCFDQKPFFNVLFDDKAGFDAATDWYNVVEILEGMSDEAIEMTNNVQHDFF